MPKRSCNGSNVILQHTIEIADQHTDSQNNVSVNIRDPKSSCRKGAPKKLRKKGQLESSSKKAKVHKSHNLNLQCLKIWTLKTSVAQTGTFGSK